MATYSKIVNNAAQRARTGNARLTGRKDQGLVAPLREHLITEEESAQVDLPRLYHSNAVKENLAARVEDWKL